MDTQLVDMDAMFEGSDAAESRDTNGSYACTLAASSPTVAPITAATAGAPRPGRLPASTSALGPDGQREQQILRDLAGGVAGELNNLLTVISGRANLLLTCQELPPGARTGLSDVLHASGRAAELVRRLLCAAGSARLYSEPIPIGGWLRSISNEIDSLLGPGIELQLRFHGEPGVAWVDRAGLRTTIRELARNARDAMPEGGRLAISASQVFHAASRCRGSRPVDASEYVLLTVSDTGHGIPDEIRDQVFRPLFTTRKSEGHPGLGLAAVEQFVHASGGEISVYSVTGEGTSFSLLLPADPADASPPR